MKKQKKVLFLLIMVQMLVLLGCGSTGGHMSKDDAEVFAEELIGEDVTYVMKDEDIEDNKIFYIFADEKG